MQRNARILIAAFAALGLVAGGDHAWAQGKGRDKQPVKKYKSTQKMAEADTGFVRVNLVLTQATSLGTTWIGYSYYDEYGDEVIYWFEYEMIEDPYTGAVDYVPVY
jgi:hypothetical protein